MDRSSSLAGAPRPCRCRPEFRGTIPRRLAPALSNRDELEPTLLNLLEAEGCRDVAGHPAHAAQPTRRDAAARHHQLDVVGALAGLVAHRPQHLRHAVVASALLIGRSDTYLKRSPSTRVSTPSRNWPMAGSSRLQLRNGNMRRPPTPWVEFDLPSQSIWIAIRYTPRE